MALPTRLTLEARKQRGPPGAGGRRLPVPGTPAFLGWMERHSPPHPGAPPAVLGSFRATCYSDIKNGLRSPVLTGAAPDACDPASAALPPSPRLAPPPGGPGQDLNPCPAPPLRGSPKNDSHPAGSVQAPGVGGHHPAVGRGHVVDTSGGGPSRASVLHGEGRSSSARHRPPHRGQTEGGGAAGGRAWAAEPPRGCARAGHGPRAELAGRSWGMRQHSGRPPCPALELAFCTTAQC